MTDRCTTEQHVADLYGDGDGSAPQTGFDDRARRLVAVTPNKDAGDKRRYDGAGCKCSTELLSRYGDVDECSVEGKCEQLLRRERPPTVRQGVRAGVGECTCLSDKPGLPGVSRDPLSQRML